MPGVFFRQRGNLHPDAPDRAAVVRRAQALGRRQRNRARELCPVKTGWLRAHIEGRVQSRRRSVWWNLYDRVHYASYQDTGFYHVGAGRRIPGRMFLTRPWNEYTPRIVSLLRQANRPFRRTPPRN